MILCYPVISAGVYAHRGSFRRLAGPDEEAQQHYSLEKFVTAEAVPAFLWHTAEDELVPFQNSLLLAGALAKFKIPVELHVFPYGVHGLWPPKRWKSWKKAESRIPMWPGGWSCA